VTGVQTCALPIYYQALQDNLQQITTGVFTPETGAADLITQLNAIIAGQ
jgi:hypothetical protein